MFLYSREGSEESTPLPRASLAPASRNSEQSCGQISLSAGSQLATHTLLLEQARTWRLASTAARYTLPAAAGAGCYSGTLDRTGERRKI